MDRDVRVPVQTAVGVHVDEMKMVMLVHGKLQPTGPREVGVIMAVRARCGRVHFMRNVR